MSTSDKIGMAFPILLGMMGVTFGIYSAFCNARDLYRLMVDEQEWQNVKRKWRLVVDLVQCVILTLAFISMPTLALSMDWFRASSPTRFRTYPVISHGFHVYVNKFHFFSYFLLFGAMVLIFVITEILERKGIIEKQLDRS